MKHIMVGSGDQCRAVARELGLKNYKMAWRWQDVAGMEGPFTLHCCYGHQEFDVEAILEYLRGQQHGPTPVIVLQHGRPRPDFCAAQASDRMPSKNARRQFRKLL